MASGTLRWREDPFGGLAHVGAGLPAIQAPRLFSDTQVMLSQASQLPHKPAAAGNYSALQSARQLSSMRLEKPHSLSYHASTFSNLPLTLV
ncbi:hypothetical protein F7R12_12615 [Pseudomonas tolaasii]|nr:hypothetical protein B5P22_09640 [Pseudomonas tolaasii]KAB0475391.1 hypothetical protein F7R12_12615 [Pseudomonas tolaasii]